MSAGTSSRSPPATAYPEIKPSPQNKQKEATESTLDIQQPWWLHKRAKQLVSTHTLRTDVRRKRGLSEGEGWKAGARKDAEAKAVATAGPALSLENKHQSFKRRVPL